MKKLCRFTRDPVESWGAEGVHVVALGPAAGQGRLARAVRLLCLRAILTGVISRHLGAEEV